MKYVFAALTIACGLALPGAGLAQDGFHNPGAVFVMTNAADRNQVIAYSRAADGTLHEVQRFDTGGRGSGGNSDPLGSQASLLLSQDGSMLFAVNAGSGDISVFRVLGSTLLLADVEPSGGAAPNALAQYGNLLYVINSGASSSVTGFRIAGFGRLQPIANSLRFLSTNITASSSLAFSPNGAFLVVIERETNNIDVFPVQTGGTLGPVNTQPSNVPGAFAVIFAPNGAALVVATGPAGAVNASAISSYLIGAGGTLAPISNDVPTLGAATCWSALTPNGQFVYTSNAGTSTISAFSVSSTGVLTPVAGTIVATNPSNLDIAMSADGKFLYALEPSAGGVGIFAIQSDGTLMSLGSVDNIGTTQGLNGIAAF
jgi:6-phosphogluconolactonase